MKRIHDGHCEHCANKNKSQWVTDCLYKGDWPSHKAFVRSTFDPPCACDAYDDDQDERCKHRNRTTRNIGLLIAGLAFMVWCLFAR